ncbi:MAG TPA: YbjN domain-containing protein [Chloroflexota bacterium]|nr:YbjN domain-containing protein [Chloroflexota bacterium]
MDFVNDAQKRIYEKIAPWMKELFGELAVAREDTPAFYVHIPGASAIVQTIVWPWGDDDGTIRTLSWVVTGADLTPECLRFLLQENADMRFGAFGVDREGDIFFAHSIVGSTCDKAELRASVLAVAATADQYDDKIVERWGGQRAIDQRR